MNKKEVLELIGKDTVLKFVLCHDSCFHFETLVPLHSDIEDLHIFSVEVYVDENSDGIFHEFNTLKDLLYRNQLAEVRKVYKDSTSKSIFFSKYEEQLNK